MRLNQNLLVPDIRIVLSVKKRPWFPFPLPIMWLHDRSYRENLLKPQALTHFLHRVIFSPTELPHG